MTKVSPKAVSVYSGVWTHQLSIRSLVALGPLVYLEHERFEASLFRSANISAHMLLLISVINTILL